MTKKQKSETTSPDPINWREIDELRAHLATPTLRTLHQESNQVKLVSYDFDSRARFPKPLSSVEIIHLTDLQVGSKAFQEDKFLEYRDWMLSKPNRFGLLGGDLLDAATVLSISSPYDNTKEPMYQVQDTVKLLKPLADAGRLLASVGGNHERRTRKTYGDCGVELARQLQVPYSAGVQLIQIRYGKHQPFTIALWHGRGASQTKGAKANVLYDFMNKFEAQAYFMGHLHDSVILPATRARVMGGKIKFLKAVGVMSSSFQAYWNSYAEESLMSPSSTFMGRAILEPNGHWEVTIR